MELDRDTIQRSDFSRTRRGYDASEVDAHLREVADAVNRLQAEVEQLSSRPASLSESANQRLRGILDAAEASAAEVRTEAGEEARRLIEEAQREAHALTEEAERRARDRDSETETTSAERLSRVDRRTTELLRRADSLEEEFDGLLERMREAAAGAVQSLRGDVEELRGELDEVPGEAPASTASGAATSADETREVELDRAGEREEATAAVEPVPEEEPLGDEVIPEPHGGEALPDPPDAPERDPTDEAEIEEAPPEPVGPDGGGPVDEEPATEPPAERERAVAGAKSSDEADTEGARLIALNMALSGSSRAETADYLRETFGLEDRALLDDVYDRVQSS
jgi:DivIVA domain-containing protein